MNAFKTRALFVLLLALPACGQQLVEFADPGPDAGLPSDDAGSTLMTDAEPGATTSTDTQFSNDAGTTTSTDTRSDAGATTSSDSQVSDDAGATTSTDTQVVSDDAGSTTSTDTQVTGSTTSTDTQVVSDDAGSTTSTDTQVVSGDAGLITSTDTQVSGDAGLITSTDTQVSGDAGLITSTDGDPVEAGVTLPIDIDAGTTTSTEAGVTLPIDIDAGGVDAGDADAGDTDAGDASDADAGDASDADAGDADAGDADAGLLPTVVLTNPLEDAINVSITKRLAATFSEPMDDATINTATFTLQGGAPVSGVVTYNGLTATFVPDDDLELDTLYTATITVGAENLAGNALAQDFSWSFRTSACAQSLVELGMAGNFGVLAASTVTNTGLTSITGNLGVSPGTAIVGFPPGVVIGTIHSSDLTAVQGSANLTTAYNEAAGRTLCSVSVAGNIGGQTLPPGLYTSTSSLEISSGELTLDAEGDEDAVFIFQVASTLTTTNGRQVFLSGGAKASNVFWQVGSSATLGTGSVFQGTIMANTAITLTTGASLSGRALALNAAVTLETNVVIIPVL